MGLDYALTTNSRETRPRSKRLRELGITGSVRVSGGMTVTASGDDGDMLANLMMHRTALDRLFNVVENTSDGMVEHDLIWAGLGENRDKDYAIKAKKDFFSAGDISAYGKRSSDGTNSGGGVGAEGLYYGDWTDYITEYDTYATSGQSVKLLYDRILSLENNGIDESQLGTLTLSRNGVAIGSFIPTKAISIDIPVPVKVSELINDEGYISNHQDISHLLSKTDAVTLYQPKGNYLMSHQDISHLLSKAEAGTLYQPKGSYLTSHQDISHLLGKADAGTLYQPKGSYLTSHQDISHLLGKADAVTLYQPKGSYLTSHQDISHLLGKADAVTLYQPKGNYLTSHQDISHLLGKADAVTLYQPKGSYLTSHQDISHLLSKADAGTLYQPKGSCLSLSGGSMANTTLVGSLNADLLDGYHILNHATGGWIRVTTHAYDATNGLRFYWNKVANIGHEGLAVLEFQAQSDANYSSLKTSRVALSGYSGVSKHAVVAPCSGYGNGRIRLKMTSNGDVWVQFSEVQWRSYGAFRVCQGGFSIGAGQMTCDGITVYTSGIVSRLDEPEGSTAIETGAIDFNVSSGKFSCQPVSFINANAASATKLQTSRAIWGQRFDGSGDVNGSFTLTDDGSVKIYTSLSPINGGYGKETVCVQTCIDNTDPQTSTYVSSQEARCILALQPRGGRVGIGTESPAQKLDVNGQIRAAGWMRTTGQSGWLNESYGGGWYMADTEWIRVYGSKNVYCGSQIIRTDGRIQVGADGSKFLADSAGNVSAAGDVSALSDMRRKDVVRHVELSLVDMARAPLFIHTWKDGANPGMFVGTSAQYWRDVLPQVVRGADDLTMAYGKAGVAMGISLARELLRNEEKVSRLEMRVSTLERIINNINII